MQTLLRVILMVVALATLSSCGSKFRNYTGPVVTKVEVHKADRKMYLLHGSQVLETYKIRLGGNPVGHKQFEGDQKTPEGAYFITHRNPGSAYHLSLGISYPNTNQVAAAAAMGQSAGGEIFIHGTPRRNEGDQDWTAGCIAISNTEIEQLYAMVRDGTPVFILP